MLLKAESPDLTDQEEAYLDQRAVSGATSLTVKDNEGWAANDHVIVGGLRQDGSELRQVASTTEHTTITIDALDYPHEAGTKLTKIPYNQVVFYRATAKGGTYSVIATEAIEVDQRYTTYNDTAGVSTSYGKVRYYNSTSTAHSDYSAEMPYAGYTDAMVRSMTDEILEQLKDKEEKHFNRDEVLNQLNRVSKILWKSVLKWRCLLTEDATLVTVADTETISLPSDFDKFQSLHYTHPDDDATYRLRYWTAEMFDKQTEDDDTAADDVDDDIKQFTIDTANSTIKLNPTPETADSVLTLKYWKIPAVLDSDSDETPFPDPGVLISWVCYKLELKRKSADEALAYKEEYREGLRDMVKLNRISTGGQPRGFRYSPDYDRTYYKG